MRRRRLASAFAGSILSASAAALATAGSVWLMVAGAGLGGIGGMLLYRSVRPAGWSRISRAFTLSRST